MKCQKYGHGAFVAIMYFRCDPERASMVRSGREDGVVGRDCPLSGVQRSNVSMRFSGNCKKVHL